MADKGMPEGVGRSAFGQPGLLDRRPDGFLNMDFMQVILAAGVFLGDIDQRLSGKKPLPGQFPSRALIFFSRAWTRKVPS